MREKCLRWSSRRGRSLARNIASLPLSWATARLIGKHSVVLVTVIAAILSQHYSVHLFYTISLRVRRRDAYEEDPEEDHGQKDAKEEKEGEDDQPEWLEGDEEGEQGRVAVQAITMVTESEEHESVLAASSARALRLQALSGSN